MQQLPQNIEAERNVLGSILKDNNILIDMIGNITAEDFYNSAHKIIFHTMEEMFKADIPIDITTVVNKLGQDNLASVGGITYLVELGNSIPSTANVKSYIDIVKEKADKRKLIKTCEKALSEAYNEEKKTSSVISLLENELLNIGQIKQNKILTDTELMELTMDIIEKNYNNGGVIPGMSLGITALDKATGGFRKGDMNVIAGRPSMGKSLLMLNLAENLGKQYKTALFELEMSAEKLGIRRLAARSLINSFKLSKGDIEDKDWDKLMQNASDVAALNNIFTDTTPGITMAEIKAKCKKLKIQYGLDLVFIDHLGLITPSSGNSRNEQIGEITKQGKIMAKDLDICVVFLSQLSRACEQRTDKRPMLSDLRESGNIEQDADAIMLLYRDEYYNRDTEDKGVMECNIAKQRDGNTGVIKLNYRPEYQKITDFYI